TSLIEINALVQELQSKLGTITHNCDRIRFEISTAQGDVDSKQSAFDIALSKLNESDARIAALTEQLAVAGQNMKSASAEVERLNIAINEANSAKGRDENELAIASTQLQQRGDIGEPDHSAAETLRNEVSLARTAEVEARLAVRTSEERVDSIAARAKALEDSAKAEREASERAVSRRGARARGALISSAIAEAAYEALIHIERSIAKAATERARLEASRSDREGETLTVRSRGRELAAELEQLTSSVHKDEIARAEQRMRIEQLESKAVEEQEKRLAATERSLTLLGKINPLALEEYNALEERLKFLAEQLEDLKRTKKDLLDIIMQSEYIVCRSGYSTLMELLPLHKKMILIPTPGQTEQAYLASSLASRQMAVIMDQATFDLNTLNDKADKHCFIFAK
ncbi:MAG: hypothetical protein EB003_11340, partial [Flavobacteriia bacterium]|nr:hypothetical protein [Flavobacteriia bacterium]